MIALKPLLILPFLVTPVSTDVCLKQKPFRTDYNINLTVADPYYDYSRSAQSLNSTKESVQNRQEWLNKNNMNELWSSYDLQIKGQAAGGWGMVMDFKMVAEPYDQYGTYYCPYFGDVNIDIFYRTMISIPKEYQKAEYGCHLDVVKTHELKHHKVNVKAIHKFVEKLEKDMPELISHMESFGTLKRDRVQGHGNFMQQGIKDAIQVYLHESMSEEMEDNNFEVDSPEEYARSSQLMEYCDDQLD